MKKSEPRRKAIIDVISIKWLPHKTPAMNESSLKTTLRMMKALADRQRVRALMLLTRGELCVCQIIAVLRLAPSTVSKHLAVLKAADLVECRKDGIWVFYRLPVNAPKREVRLVMDWLRKSLQQVPEILKDREALGRVLKCDPAVLCRQQRDKAGTVTGRRGGEGGDQWHR